MDVDHINEPPAASTARSPVESGRQGQTGASDHEQNVVARPMSSKVGQF